MVDGARTRNFFFAVQLRKFYYYIFADAFNSLALNLFYTLPCLALLRMILRNFLYDIGTTFMSQFDNFAAGKSDLKSSYNSGKLSWDYLPSPQYWIQVELVLQYIKNFPRYAIRLPLGTLEKKEISCCKIKIHEKR